MHVGGAKSEFDKHLVQPDWGSSSGLAHEVHAANSGLAHVPHVGGARSGFDKHTVQPDFGSSSGLEHSLQLGGAKSGLAHPVHVGGAKTGLDKHLVQPDFGSNSGLEHFVHPDLKSNSGFRHDLQLVLGSNNLLGHEVMRVHLCTYVYGLRVTSQNCPMRGFDSKPTGQLLLSLLLVTADKQQSPIRPGSVQS